MMLYTKFMYNQEIPLTQQSDRMRHIQHALSHVAIAIQLEIADTILEKKELSQDDQENLDKIYAGLLHVSQLSIATSVDIETILREKRTVSVLKEPQNEELPSI